jgi:hypothetical protein
MRLERMEITEHSAAARIFDKRLFLAEVWDLEADTDARVVRVHRKQPHPNDPRQPRDAMIPFEKIEYMVAAPAATAGARPERSERVAS